MLLRTALWHRARVVLLLAVLSLILVLSTLQAVNETVALVGDQRKATTVFSSSSILHVSPATLVVQEKEEEILVAGEQWHSSQWPRGAANMTSQDSQFIDHLHQRGILLTNGSSRLEQGATAPTGTTAIERPRYTNLHILSGTLRVAPQARPSNLSDPHTAVDYVSERRCQRAPPGGKANVVFVLCALVLPHELEVAKEWIQWHRLLGVKHFHLVMAAPRGRNPELYAARLRQSLRVLVEANLVTVTVLHVAVAEAFSTVITDRVQLEKERELKSTVLTHCVSLRVTSTSVSASPMEPASSSAFVGYLSPYEFIHLPQGGCLSEVFPLAGPAPVPPWQQEGMPPSCTDNGGPLGYALPKMRTTHRGELRNIYRTQLERTRFSMGCHEDSIVEDPLVFYRVQAMLRCLHVPPLSSRSTKDKTRLEWEVGAPFERLVPFPLRSSLQTGIFFVNRMTLSSILKNPTQSGDRTMDEEGATIRNRTRILVYRYRTFDQWLIEQLSMGSQVQPFSVWALRQHWDSQREIGRTNLAHYNTGLSELHQQLLISLGFTREDVMKRVRAVVSNAPIDPQVQTVLAPLFGLRMSEKAEVESITHQNVAEGAVRLVREPLLRPVGDTEIEWVSQQAECQQQSRERFSPPSVEVTMCLYVRNRAKLTVEWIQWHRILGASRFLIIDDHSSDGLQQLLQPFIEKGVVALLPVPAPPYRFRDYPVSGGLLAGYGACLDYEVARMENGTSPSWVGLFDSDEFIVLPSPVKRSTVNTSGGRSVGGGHHKRQAQQRCLQDLIADTLVHSPIVGAVALPWKVVGHHGELVDDKRTQFERTEFAFGAYDHLQRVKCFVRADLPTAMETAHKAVLQRPYMTAFPDGSQLTSDGWWSGLREDSKVYDLGHVLHLYARSGVSWIQRHLDGFADDDVRIWEDPFYEFRVDSLFKQWMMHKEKVARGIPPRHLEARHRLLLEAMGFTEK